MPITTAAAHNRRWDQGCRSHLKLRHQLARIDINFRMDIAVASIAALGGLHREYRLEWEAA